VDARLFNRTTRRLNLTEDGRVFLAEVSEGLARLNAAKDHLHESNKRVSGTLRVLLPNSFCKNYMMPDLAEFLIDHREFSLDMHVEDYPVDLLKGGFEVAVQFGRPPNTGYISRYLGAMRIVLAASPDYLARRGVPRMITDLDDHDRINVRSSDGGSPFLWQIARDSNQNAKSGFTVHRPEGQCFVNSQLDAAIQAAVHGVGITPVDIGAAQRLLDDGLLKIVLPEYSVITGGELYLLYPHRDHLPMKVRAFIDFLIEVARRRLCSNDFDPFRYAA
jgi:DNA-binding transcriptional LysR family regulator